MAPEGIGALALLSLGNDACIHLFARAVNLLFPASFRVEPETH